MLFKLLYTIEQPHGLGELYFKWQKGESHSLLATTGTDATVAIHDRGGQLLERLKLPGYNIISNFNHAHISIKTLFFSYKASLLNTLYLNTLL